MRFLPVFFWILAIMMSVASFINPGSGWGIGGIAFTILGVIIVVINLVRTGKPFTEETGGH